MALSKIFERATYTRLKTHIDEQDILVNHQFGFRPGKGTSDAIELFLDRCYDTLENRGYMLSLFLDMSKAFDTLDHGILLDKLDHVGLEALHYGGLILICRVGNSVWL